MFHVLLWIWQFPQNIVGFIYVKKNKLKKMNLAGIEYYYQDLPEGGGITLGGYIIVDILNIYDKRVIFHEFGHTKQSQRLGVLYPLVIGLPSITWAWIYNRFDGEKRGWDYEWFYTESWATKLGKLINMR